MNRLVFISFAMIALMLGVGQFVGKSHPLSSGHPAGIASSGASSEASDAAKSAFVASDPYGGDTMGIRRGPDGQFHLTAQIDGNDTRFLVDTGADLVALTVDEAQRLGIFVDPTAFQPILRTASGTGYGQHVKLDDFQIGGRDLSGVDAVVVQGLDTNLLGQSVLRRLGRVELQGDRLVIEPS